MTVYKKPPGRAHDRKEKIMERSGIERELKTFTGGLFITQTQLKQALNCGTDTMREVLAGLDYICINNILELEESKRFQQSNDGEKHGSNGDIVGTL